MIDQFIASDFWFMTYGKMVLMRYARVYASALRAIAHEMHSIA